MRRCIQVWLFTLLTLAVLSPPTSASKKNWTVKAKLIEKRGVILTCSSAGGHIVSLSVVGMKADKAGQCQGLTAGMFVQVNSCLWKEKCTLKKDRYDNYLVKLYRGTPAACITKKPKIYDITYYCTDGNVRVIDMPAAGQRALEREEKGVVRSHVDHPWLYIGQGGTNQNVTLVNPDFNTLKTFVYTILTLRLYNDVLMVRPEDRSNGVTLYTDDVTTRTPVVIEGVKSVTFQLEMSRHSIGGEGFVFCFQWVTKVKDGEDACSGLISLGMKPKKGKKQRRKKVKNDGKKDTNKIRKASKKKNKRGKNTGKRR